MEQATRYKAKDVLGDTRRSSLRKYRDLYYGNTSLAFVCRAELTAWFCASATGAWGLFMRSRLLPGLFASCGGNTFFGRNVTLRHSRKIRLGSNVIIDDNCLLDAKGETNSGIIIEDNVFIGRNTMIYCKNGNVRIKKGASISSNCTIFSSNDLTIGEGTLVGGYSYLLSGGEYDCGPDAPPFAEQTGMPSVGPLSVGDNCWLGARVLVLDAACIGNHAVVGGGAVVNKPLPADSVAVGVPARLIGSSR